MSSPPNPHWLAAALAMFATTSCALDEASVGAPLSAVTDARGLFCPPGTTADLVHGYCVDAGNAYGPFTRAMREACVGYGGGPACDATLRFDIDGHAVDIPRWNRAFADALRGSGACPAGRASPRGSAHASRAVTHSVRSRSGSWRSAR